MIVRAAPPRVSPSSFVKITPSKSITSLNAFAVLTASCPVIESTTKRVSVGFIAFFMFEISLIISSSTAKRPAVSTITTPIDLLLAYEIASCAIETASLVSSLAKTSTPICSPKTLN